MKVLVLNPGATSTKISIFEEENEVFKTNLVHHAADLAPYAHVIDQGFILVDLAAQGIECKLHVNITKNLQNVPKTFA